MGWSKMLYNNLISYAKVIIKRCVTCAMKIYGFCDLDAEYKMGVPSHDNGDNS